MKKIGWIVLLLLVIFFKNGWTQQTTGEQPVTQTKSTIEALFLQTQEAVQNGDYPKAIENCTKIIEIDPTNAVVYALRGGIYGEQNKYAEAIADSYKAIELQPDFGDAYGQLGWYLILQGKFAEAKAPCQKAYELTPENYAWSVNLGHVYLLTGDAATARTYYEKALSLIASEEEFRTGLNADFELFIKNGWQVETCRKELAWMEAEFQKRAPQLRALAEAEQLNQQVTELYQQGKYAEAIPLAEQTLALREKTLGKEHPDTATSLNNLAVLYDSMGNYAKAEPLSQRALAIREKVLGPEHPDTASSLNSLATLYDSMGNYAKAEPLSQRALAIREKVLGPEHPDTALSLNNLAALYDSMSDYAKAEPLYQRALAITEKALGPEHPDMASSLNNLAGLYDSMGDYAKAEPLLQRALAITEKALGAEHPDTASSLNNLATLYDSMSAYAKAEPLYQRALAIREKVLGAEHPGTASSLNNLATLYVNMGVYAKAEPLLQRALAIREQVLGPEHPHTAGSLNNLAGLYDSMGDYAKAEPLHQRALAIREKVLGPEHPNTAASLNNLASLYAEQGNIEQAHTLFLRAQQIEEQMIAQVLGFTAEAQQQAFLDTTRGNLEIFLTLISQQLVQNAAARKDGLDVWLRRKGVILEAQKRFQEALLLSDDPAVLKTFEALSQVRMQLSQLTFAGPGKGQPEVYQQGLDALKQQQEALEAQLSRLSAAFAARRKVAKADVASVAQALPANSALVEFVQIDLFNFSAKGQEDRWQPAHYLAFVLHAGDAENVQLIDLGEAPAIDAEVAAFKSELSRKDAPDFARAQRLAMRAYSAVFAPLKAALGDTTHLFISPDGNLNLLPFEVLIDPDDEDERFLIEQYQFNYLAAGRDVVGFGQLAGQETPQQPLLFGAPDFDVAKGEPTLRQAQGSAQEGNAETMITAARRSADLTLSGFTPLPGAKAELETIQTLVGHDHSTLFMDKDATENALLQSRVPRFLHVATHGFFLPDQPLPEVKDGLMGLDQPARVTPTGKRFENPLLRSGLALAGANVGLKDGTDQGLFTADKVLGLRLRGTDVVVLSACDTGLGDVQIGEGVYGLRRAFLQAGARSLVMSLWSVPDVETKELMIRFYENVLAGKMSRAEALRDAILREKQEIEARYGLPHPAYWGAFVFLGEP